MRYLSWLVLAGLITACCFPFGDDDPAPTAPLVLVTTASVGGPATIMPTVATTAEPREAAFVTTHIARLVGELPCGQDEPGPISISLPLYGFYTGRAAAAEYPFARASSGWQYQGGSFADIRRVGNHWVAVEVPQNNPLGIYVSVFADNLV